jgi:hypothetical protein
LIGFQGSLSVGIIIEDNLTRRERKGQRLCAEIGYRDKTLGRRSPFVGNDAIVNVFYGGE